MTFQSLIKYTLPYHLYGDSCLLLVIGLSGDKESAQDYASTGVGLLSGSSILLLTVVWGTCVIVGKQKLENDPSDSNTSDPSSGKIKELLTSMVSSIIDVTAYYYI